MKRRQITLEDGRYLIFYKFDEHWESSPKRPLEKSSQTDERPVVEGERGV